jgi:hypothetical protein
MRTEDMKAHNRLKRQKNGKKKHEQKQIPPGAWIVVTCVLLCDV